MEDWKKYSKEGKEYLKAAFGAYSNKKLGNSVIYNLIGLSIESYLTALCMKLNILPEHSSIGSMLHTLKKHVEVPETFSAESRFMNRFMNFCALDICEVKEPDNSDVVRMLNFMGNIRDFAEEYTGFGQQLNEMQDTINVEISF